MSALDLAAVRSRFPALSRVQDGRPVVFADAPGGSQVPDTVIEAVSQRYRDGISNMDGAFVVSEETEELAAAARRAGADLVGAEPRSDRVRRQLDLAAPPPVSVVRAHDRTG